MKEKREKKRRGRRGRRRDQGQQGMELWIFVWKLTLIIDFMIFGMDLWVCEMIILSPNLGF